MKGNKMNVLFISSGNSKNGISPIIKNQGESLKKEHIELDYFTIKGKGVKGYFKAIFTLRAYLKKNNTYDVVHVHYWLSAIVASLAGAKPMVVSLMGDDVKAKSWFKWIIYIFNFFSWSMIIVKSKDMYDSLGLKKAYIIPNGIDMSRFRPIDKGLAQKELGWDISKRHILFTSDPKRVEKNFQLVEKALNIIDDKNLELHYLKDIPNEKIFYYYNASDVVVLTSLWEGSPNAIKESMACNRPIVSTNVGDVKDVLSKADGCYISTFNPKDVALKIEKALEHSGTTTGREDIQYLKSEIIAKRVIDIYNKVKGKI
jgi:glycosyltransferase involved in cell wall biosynthesis